MSLIQQIRIAISIVILLVATGCLFLSVYDNHHYLADQLQKKNNDNANTLAMTLSNIEKDAVTVELIIASQFDIGHYKRIAIISPENKPIIERIEAPQNHAAPAWFSQLFNMDIAPGYAIIQSGWKQYGTLQIESNVNLAYEQLWSSTKHTLLWIFMVAVVVNVLCSMLLKKILSPLNQVIHQAESIGARRYITIPEPNTLEFKALVKAMNTLSLRVQSMVKEESMRLDSLNQQINYDDVSGLMNQSFFSNVVSVSLRDEQFSDGALWIIQLKNLPELDQSLGYARTNALIKDLAETLYNSSAQYANMMCGRLGGSHFAIFSKQGIDDFEFANLLKTNLSKLSAQDASVNMQMIIVHTKAKKADEFKDLIKVMQFILDLAVENSPHAIRIMNANSIVASRKDYLSQWNKQFLQAIEHKQLKLERFPVIHRNGSIHHYECVLRLQLEDNGPWLAAGVFIDWATQLDLIKTLDMLALEYAIDSYSNTDHHICLNISASAMKSQDYLELMTKHIHKLQTPEQFCFEVQEDAAFLNFEAFKRFCHAAKALGCQVGLEHVSMHLSQLGELHQIGLDYIKFDGSLIRDLHELPQQQSLLRGLCLMVRSMGITPIAEGVQTEQEMDAVHAIGFEAMTGTIVK